MKVRFYLRKDNGTAQDGMLPIYMRISNGDQYPVSTGLRIPQRFWNHKKQEVHPAFYDSANFNEELNRLKSDAMDLYWQVRRTLGTHRFSAREVVNRMQEKYNLAKPVKGIVDGCKDFVVKKTKNLSEGSSKIYYRMLAHLEAFCKSTGRNKWSMVDDDFCSEFPEFLFKGGAYGKPNSTNTVAGIMGAFNAFLRYATTKKWLLDDSVIGVNVKSVELDKISLTQSEVMQIWNANLTHPDHIKVRDAFVFSCFCGPRISDVSRLNEGKVSYDPGLGIHILKYAAKKNKKAIQVPLNAIAVEIFNKYGDFSFMKDSELDSKTRGDYLREVCKLAGINTPTTKTSFVGGKREETIVPKWELITFHIARASFITLMIGQGRSVADVALLAGISLPTVMNYYRPSKEQLFNL